MILYSENLEVFEEKLLKRSRDIKQQKTGWDFILPKDSIFTSYKNVFSDDRCECPTEPLMGMHFASKKNISEILDFLL